MSCKPLDTGALASSAVSPAAASEPGGLVEVGEIPTPESAGASTSDPESLELEADEVRLSASEITFVNSFGWESKAMPSTARQGTNSAA